MKFWPLPNSDFPTRLSTNFMTLIPALTFTELYDSFPWSILQRVWHASRERLPFRTPGSVPIFWLALLQLLREKEGDLTQSYDKTPYTNRKFENQRTLRPNSLNLPCLYSTFHLEYPLVLSRFCFENQWVPNNTSESAFQFIMRNRKIERLDACCIGEIRRLKMVSWLLCILEDPHLIQPTCRIGCFTVLPKTLLMCVSSFVRRMDRGSVEHMADRHWIDVYRNFSYFKYLFCAECKSGHFDWYTFLKTDSVPVMCIWSILLIKVACTSGRKCLYFLVNYF